MLLFWLPVGGTPKAVNARDVSYGWYEYEALFYHVKRQKMKPKKMRKIIRARVVSSIHRVVRKNASKPGTKKKR